MKRFPNGLVAVISGPSGSGESTVTKELVRRLRGKRLVTATTRKPRSGETEGVDYFFFTKKRFLEEVRNGNIPEHTHIPNRDTYYGTYRPELERDLSEGFLVIANTDIVGTRFFKENYRAITIFIVPDSLETLAGRLRGRNPEISEEELEKRLENARSEMETEGPFYEHTIENRDGELEEAVKKAEAVIRKRLHLPERR